MSIEYYDILPPAANDIHSHLIELLVPELKMNNISCYSDYEFIILERLETTVIVELVKYNKTNSTYEVVGCMGLFRHESDCIEYYGQKIAEYLALEIPPLRHEYFSAKYKFTPEDAAALAAMVGIEKTQPINYNTTLKGENHVSA